MLLLSRRAVPTVKVAHMAIGTEEKIMPFNSDVQILQTWFSPSFPIGSFTYSHGLETAIRQNVVTDRKSLTRWIAFILEFGSGRNDGLCLKEAYQGEDINDLSKPHQTDTQTGLVCRI